ncbi:amylo-alpha-1,6-glucosidase [Actinomadura sp. NBRC 104412]|uniref:glycogen debranching N-terminal domain-containing protein n=1 Tax=Actinomadura sp. NBRC 104412 TaxID=3032203 RepID=UPI0024A191F3|nr:glycogen debranching N-terminal domain-containing protein [Actinomadura sp. NBRC 104412]GLZ02843.1 amylo-alpha-1,6-glucosidase [Actinomadura sp. NBRC 104412]
MHPPPLHEHITCVAAPAIWLSPRSGQLTGGADGLYVADRRVLSRLLVTVDGAEPVPVEAVPDGASGARFLASAGDVTVERIRTVTRDGGTERIVLRNRGEAAVTAKLEIAAAADLAPVATVRSGNGATLRQLALVDGVERSASDGFRVRLDGRTRAEPSLAPGESFTTTITIKATPPRTSGFRPAPPSVPAPWADAPLTVDSPDTDLDRLVAQGVDDLTALLLADGDDLYSAAGSPWYLTLFGRDALWTARLALPLGHELAAGTLRALARRQGTRTDPATEEEPGKIPHELRPDDTTGWLPPLYYGTVDATPLFVVTLAEAWRWGMPSGEVEALLPAVERALGWLGGFDEFVHYVGSAETLANQGWKDSSDGVQHADGRLPRPPIALSEVQAYAYQAATLGADLLDAFGRPGADRWRSWAAALADRFRSRFWLDGYPAIALDGNGDPVDGVASNMGHLLGTGLLTPDEEARVAARLPELDSGFGLRTLTPHAAGFDPLSYHLGSVWPHDTVIAILGLVRTGHAETAARLARGLVAAAPAFGHRLPELFGGQDATRPPVPYPTACSPQAWAAAVSPALVTALLGLDVDLPEGRVSLSPVPGFGPLSVRNIRIGATPLSVEVARDGTVTTTGGPDVR